MANSRGELQMAPPEIEGEDYSQKLPKDLLVMIFSKLVVNSSISDLKFIFRCSLVSKRFNSIISTTTSSIQTLSLTNNNAQIKKKFLKKIMGKFHNLKSLYIEYNKLESDLKWKAVYRSGIYCFVAIQMKWESEVDGVDSESELEPDGVLQRSERISAMIKFHELMVLFIRKHKMLNKVVIADANKQGKISFGDKLIRELRNDPNYNTDEFRLPAYVQSGIVPQLCVPLFGSSSQPVEFLIIKSRDKARGIYSGSDIYMGEDDYIRTLGLDDNDDIMNWDFDDEEKEFGEALTIILRDHKDKIWISKS